MPLLYSKTLWDPVLLYSFLKIRHTNLLYIIIDYIPHAVHFIPMTRSFCLFIYLLNVYIYLSYPFYSWKNRAKNWGSHKWPRTHSLVETELGSIQSQCSLSPLHLLEAESKTALHYDIYILILYINMLNTKNMTYICYRAKPNFFSRNIFLTWNNK